MSKKGFQTVSIMIPVFNESDYLHQVLARVEAVDFCGLKKEIILVDDGSTDNSRELLAQIEAADKPGYRVLFHPHNRGKGASLRSAIEVANGDIILIQDADLEYDPQDYNALLKQLIDGHADVVYGSRFGGRLQPGAFGRLHYLGNKLLTAVTRLLYRTTITDMETCYKAFRAPVLKGMRLHANRFDIEPEMTAKVLKAGWRLQELPIGYLGRTSSEGKKITWRDGLMALYTLLKYRFVD